MARRWIWLALGHGVVAASLHGQIPAGAVGTIGGDGNAGFSDGGRPAVTAQIELSYGVAADAWGNVYVADSWNHRVRRIAPDGTIRVFAGTGSRGFSGDGGLAVSANLNFPRAVAADGWGNVFVADSGNGVIRRVRPDGVIDTVAGSRQTGYAGDGDAAARASLGVPRGMAVDTKGNLYIADSFNARIRKVGTDGKISTIAGTGEGGYSGDGRPATRAAIGLPHSIEVDSKGVVYFSDILNHCVRRIRTDGIIETVAGTGESGYSGDGGPAASAKLSFPRGLAIDPAGNVYVADSRNHRIRRIGADGRIATVAGTGVGGFGGDQGRADLAVLNEPYGLNSDARGNLYVTDLRNYRVRKFRFEALRDKPSLAAEGAVVNSASRTAALSPGVLFTVQGTAFGYEKASSDFPLAPSLAGTSVLINGKPAPLVSSSPDQINAQLPWNASSPARVKVSFGGVESNEVSVPVAAASPGIFVNGENQAVAMNQDGAANSPANPAARGTIVVLHLTGLGEVSPPQVSGVPAGADPRVLTVAETTAVIGDVAAAVKSSALAAGYIGLWLVEVEVPADSPTGEAIPVKVLAGGVESNTALLSVQ